MPPPESIREKRDIFSCLPKFIFLLKWTCGTSRKEHPMRKNRYLKLLLATLASTACLHAETASLLVPATQNAEQPKKPHFYEYHNRVILFQPSHQGYERIKPKAFYVGVEG